MLSRATLPRACRIFDQAAQDAGAAFCRLVSEDGAAIIAGGQWFAEHLAFLQLEDDLDAPHQRVLDGGDRFQARTAPGSLKRNSKRILAISHDGDDAHRPDDIRRDIDISDPRLRISPSSRCADRC